MSHSHPFSAVLCPPLTSLSLPTSPFARPSLPRSHLPSPSYHSCRAGTRPSKGRWPKYGPPRPPRSSTCRAHSRPSTSAAVAPPPPPLPHNALIMAAAAATTHYCLPNHAGLYLEVPPPRAPPPGIRVYIYTRTTRTTPQRPPSLFVYFGVLWGEYDGGGGGGKRGCDPSTHHTLWRTASTPTTTHCLFLEMHCCYSFI